MSMAGVDTELNGFDHKHFHGLLVARNIDNNSTPILISQFSVKMLCLFVDLGRGEKHTVSLCFHICFPMLHQHFSEPFSLVLPIDKQHGAEGGIILKEVIPQQANGRILIQ